MIETISDLLQAKAAVIGERRAMARAKRRLPLFAAVPFRQQTSFPVIGERANANGSRRFGEAMLNADWETAERVARDQVREGGKLLDVCVDYTGADGISDMAEIASRSSGWPVEQRLSARVVEGDSDGLERLRGRRLGQRGSERQAQAAPPAPRSPEVAAGNRLFTPPFVGSRIVRGIPIDDVASYINPTALYRNQWGFRPTGGETDQVLRGALSTSGGSLRRRLGDTTPPCEHWLVYGPHRLVTSGPPQHILGEQHCRPVEHRLGDAAYMWCSQDARMIDQRMSRVDRLVGEHVEPGTTHLPGLESVEQCLFVHETTPRDVDEDSARLQRSKGSRIEHVAVGAVEHRAADDDIGPAQHPCHVARADHLCDLGWAPERGAGANSDQVGAKGREPPRHGSADSAEPDDDYRGVEHRTPSRHPPLPRPCVSASVVQPLGEGQDVEHRELGNAVCIARRVPREAADPDPERRRLVDVDLVEAHPELLHQAEGTGFQHRAVDGCAERAHDVNALQVVGELGRWAGNYLPTGQQRADVLPGQAQGEVLPAEQRPHRVANWVGTARALEGGHSCDAKPGRAWPNGCK